MINKYWDPTEDGYGTAPTRKIRLCTGHRYMIGRAPEDYFNCEVHGIDSLAPDEILEQEFTPVVFLDHACESWVIGGRNELLQLRDDVDELLSQMP